MKTYFSKVLVLSLFALLIVGPLCAQQHPGLMRYLSQHQEELGLDKMDVQNWRVYDQHTDKNKGIQYVYIVQQVNGLDVFNAVATFAIVGDRVLLTGNDLIPGLGSVAIGSSPQLSAETGIRKAANYLQITEPTYLKLLEKQGKNAYLFEGGDISVENIPVKLLYCFDEHEKLHLVWDLSIYNGKDHWWSMRMDANDGSFVSQTDWVTNCQFGNDEGEGHFHGPRSVTKNAHTTNFGPLLMPPPNTDAYNVFPIPVESPSHGSRSLVVGPYDPVSSPYGWHDDNGANGNEYTITRGNNVHAQEDVNGNNGNGYSPSGGASLSFDFPLNLNQAPSGYQDAAITNLFYMNNIMHDVYYHYGFDEASGNFQENNYGNGGLASDMVYADAQDGSGTNNANFATPGDGSNPRMQMFLWDPGITNLLTVNSPASIAGAYGAVEAGFGAPVPATPITTNLVLYVDNAGVNPNDACENPTNAAAQNGKIVVIYRGDCEFGSKVLKAQQAGAVAVIMINNVPGSPITMGAGAQGGSVTIPSIMISDVDGAAIVAQMSTGTVNATIVNNGSFQTDGDFDNMIVAHEYGHGISKRLTGGASNSSCLGNDEQMGEGWSDWFGLMLTIEPGDQSTDNRGVGTYVTGEPNNGTGIRPAPYNTDFNVNGFTYAATNNTATISQPHGIGFVWCTILWDMTWALIDKYGYDPDVYNGTGGNNVAMHLVVTALKLQPCSPGFVTGRDAILQADQLLYNGANQCLIWNAFATRGVGFSASQGNANSRTDQTEAFDMPSNMVNVTGSENVTACGAYVWPATGLTYNNTGAYTANLFTTTGCDSIVTLNLTIAAPTTGSTSASACSSYTWPTSGMTYTSSGNYTTTLVNAAGCDSIVTLNLTINNPYNVTEVVSSCANYFWPATGQTYSTTGQYVANLISINGCDSIVTLDLTMSSIASSTQNVTTCGPYTWALNGATYTSTTTDQVQLMATSGCDSIVTLNLTVNAPSASTQSASACDMYVWPVNNMTYSTSGQYTATIPNSVGCDSVITLDLTINNSVSGATQTISNCGAYTWPLTGISYSSSGIYTTTLSTINGCDSIVSIDLTINQASSGVDSVTACGSYTWPANNQTYTNAGNYSTILSNAAGCDSNVTLVLTINSVNTGIAFIDIITLGANQAGATYQWLDCDSNYVMISGATNQTFSPIENGNYCCAITINGCTDTTDCRSITKVGIEENELNDFFNLYPNPTSDKVIIELGENLNNVELKLFAINGQLIATKKYSFTSTLEYQLDVAPGSYFIEVTDLESNRKARVKVIKE